MYGDFLNNYHSLTSYFKNLDISKSDFKNVWIKIRFLAIKISTHSIISATAPCFLTSHHYLQEIKES